MKVTKEVAELESKCDEALTQIEDRKYDSPLEKGGYKDIIKYGIAFYRKDCMIKK